MSFKDLTFRLFGEDRTATSALSRLSKNAEDASGRISRGFAPLAKVLGGVAVAAAAGAALIVKTGIDEAMDASKGMAQLQAGIASTGNVANVSVAGMENLASSIQNMSGQTDDSIVATEQLLLTFTNIRNRGPDKIFDQATLAAANMAAKMGGDASSKAVLLGKALNDPVKGITALTRVGVAFTAGQKEQIKALVKSGDTLGAQKIILRELNTEFGGAAKAAGESLPGQLARAKRAFEDVSQSVVETILPVVTPAIAGLADKVRAAQPFLEQMARIVAKNLGSAFRGLAPVLKEAGGFIATVLLPAIAALASWMGKNSQTALLLAGAILAGVIAYRAVATAVAVVQLAMTAAGMAAALFRTAQVGATAASYGFAGATYATSTAQKVAYVTGLLLNGTLVKTGALWVAGRVQAVAAAAATGASWAAAQAGIVASAIGSAAKTAAIWTAQAARAAAGWVVLRVQAIAAFAATAASAVANGVAVAGAWVAQRAAALGYIAVQGLLRAATIISTATQWALNAAMSANPIGIVVVAIAALVAGLVWFFTQTKVGKDIVSAAFKGIQAAFRWVQDAAAAVFGWIGKNWPLLLGILTGPIGLAVLFVISHWKQIQSTTSAVFAAVRSVVSGAIAAVVGFVVGGISNLVGRWIAGWNAVTGAVTSVNARIVATVAGLVVRVVGYFVALPGRIRAAVGNAGAILLDIGRHIVSGLITGLQGAWGAVTGAVRTLVNLIPDGARKLLGIASPSKVFKQIGDWVGKGLRDGLNGSKSDVVGAMNDLIGKVKAIPAKDLASSAKNALLDRLRSDTAKLKQLAGERDKVSATLKSAQEKLATAISTRNDYRSSISGSVFGLGAVTNAKGATDADGTTQALTAADVLAQKQDALSKATAFKAQIDQLKSMGLNSDDYKAVVDAFAQNGDTSLASTLVTGGPTAIRQINDLNTQLKAASASLGTDTSNRLYQAGVDSAQGIANGLKDQLAVIDTGFGVVEKQVSKALSKAGIASKSLATEAGKDIADGLAIGMKSRRNALEDEAGKLSKSMLASIKKALGIRSPSTRFRDEVGAMIPAGIVEGVRGGADDLDRELAALITVAVRTPATASTETQPALATAGGRTAPLVHIENFHATPEQSPAEIAGDLGWLMSGGLE